MSEANRQNGAGCFKAQSSGFAVLRTCALHIISGGMKSRQTANSDSPEFSMRDLL